LPLATFREPAFISGQCAGAGTAAGIGPLVSIDPVRSRDCEALTGGRDVAPPHLVETARTPSAVGGQSLAVDSEVPDAALAVGRRPKDGRRPGRARLAPAAVTHNPRSHEALSTEECLAAVERARPNAPAARPA